MSDEGVTGETIQESMGDLVNHDCNVCGSVPLSGNNNPNEMGILTANFVGSKTFAMVFVRRCDKIFCRWLDSKSSTSVSPCVQQND